MTDVPIRDADDMTERPLCELCGAPMPHGEEMFKFHGYSGPCPTLPSPGADPIVGHKTFSTPDGGLRHEPLRESEAAAILAASDRATVARAELMPTERDAIGMFFEAWLRLKELGWKDAMYCPKDGSTFDAIEAGSTGIHRCHYEGKWPTGTYWVESHFDLWPSHPVLVRVTNAGRRA